MMRRMLRPQSLRRLKPRGLNDRSAMPNLRDRGGGRSLSRIEAQRRLRDLQGAHRTFYVGGVTDFELIEPIVQHSKHLVEKHFLGPA